MRTVLDFQFDGAVAPIADAWAAERQFGLLVASDGTRLYTRKVPAQGALRSQPTTELPQALIISIRQIEARVHLVAQDSGSGLDRGPIETINALLQALGQQPLGRTLARGTSFRSSLGRLKLFFDRHRPARPGAGLKWLDGYAGQTTAQLIGLEDGYRLDSIVLAFERALDQKADSVGLAYLSEPEQVILAVEAVEREVNNGGYDQLFRNSSKGLTPYFVSSFRAIGCPEVAAITERAIKALKLQGPISIEAIDAAMDRDDGRRDDRFAKCDGEYFASAGDLAGPLFRYIKANAGRVRLV